jgi:ribosomal RNA assembly protein
MRRIHYCDKELGRILAHEGRNIRHLEKEFKTKITIHKGKTEADFIINGNSSVQEYLILEILEALAVGFDLEIAMLLKNEEVVFKKVELKKYVHGGRLEVIKGRIVGSQGKSKRVIQSLTECDLCLCDNNVAIIGHAENVELASRAIESLIRGSKHANVFKLLEKGRVAIREEDVLLDELEEEMSKKK